MSVKNKAEKDSKKRTPRKKRPKVMLDNKSVMLLSAVIIFLCAVFLSMAFVFSSSKPEKTAKAPKKEQPLVQAEQKPEPKKNPEPQIQKNNIPKPEPSAESQPKKTAAQEPKKEPPAENRSAPKVQPVIKEEKKEAPPKVASALPPPKKPEEIPVEKYKIPDARNGATLVFVIDDGGYDISNLKLYTSLPFPVAVAVLPKLAHSRDCAEIVRNSGQELMLHQPMQAQNLNINPGEGAVLPEMSLTEIYRQVCENIMEIGPVRGLNNHEGSLITCDVMKIGAVLDAVYDNGIFFMDSRTSAQTKAPQAALERGMEILQRDVFIDDIISREEMLAQIYRGLGIANRNGKVVMIGHVDKSAKILPPLLKDMYPYLKRKGYKFAFPSQIQ
ncbi:divergent polysaccharide deacetylase family protein [Treponema sp.]|uniref:divergent polysaccharide deacetylase family protein n=1 Tax=Treponema sp. TaxID=166 RepID=UPI003EFC5E0A